MHTRSQSRRRRTIRVWLEGLETRALLTSMPPTLSIPLNKDLDQFGDQIVTVQGFESSDGTSATGAGFGIFDTGASAVTFSPDDASLFDFYGNPIPIKNPGGAQADGIGGTVTGDVSQPVTIVADGLHASQLKFDAQGFPLFDFNFGGAARTDGIQAFVGTQSGSPDLPTITGTPLLEPSTLNPSGLAAKVDMTGQVLDFSDIAPGLVLPFPDVHFVDPTTAALDAKDGVTAPIVLDLHPYGPDSYANPGDAITSAPNVTLRGVSATYGADASASTQGHKTFLFDTGAQISVISTSMAQAFGLDLAHPETSISVQGVGGSQDVPGFTIAKLDIPRRDGGLLDLTNLPVYVLDVADGIDGIFGMNAMDTASQILFSPYDPAGASVSFTFLTDPNRGDPAAGGGGGEAGNLLLHGGVPFGGALHGRALPTLAPKLAGGGIPESTTTRLAIGPTSPVVGQDETLTATVTASLRAAGGSVTFTDTFKGVTRTLGTATLDAQDHAVLTTHALEAGVHELKATYGGQSSSGAGTRYNRPSASTRAALTVARPHAAVSMPSAGTGLALGDPATISVTVSAVEATTARPSGKVAFYDGPTKLGEAPLDASGVAKLRVTGLGGGTHAIGADFSGSPVFLDAKATGSVGVARATPSLVFNASTLTESFGRTPIYATTVTTSAGLPAPTGHVTLKDGRRVIGGATLDAAGHLTALIVEPRPEIGTHSVTATYDGDTNFMPVSSSPLSITIAKDGTTLAIRREPPAAGDPAGVKLTATLTGVPVPSSGMTGLVAFYDGATLLATIAVTDPSRVVYIAGSLTAGDHALSASYLGDPHFQASTSPPLAVSLGGGGGSTPGATVTSLVAGPGSAVYGQAIALTATVTAAAGLDPSGQVVFYDGGAPIGSATIRGGVALLAGVAPASIGTHTLTAAYFGDARDAAGASAPVAFLVTQADTQTTLTLAANPVRVGAPHGSTLLVAVGPISPGAGSPTGVVVVKIGKTNHRMTLDHGVARLGLSPRGLKRHPTITASYLGNATFKASSTSTIRGPKSGR